MIDPLKSLLKQQGLSKSAFSSSSRYNGIETVTIDKDDGETIVYLKRRFLPDADNFSLLQEHIVTEGERLDNITNQYIGDPEKFWQICDANNVMHPDELTDIIGRQIKLTLPQGIPGTYNA